MADYIVMADSESGAVPAGLLERVRHINKIYTQTIRLVPVNQGTVTNGNKILLQFPTDSVLDLKTLSFDAFIQTCHMGNTDGNAANNYTQTYYLPRNGIASMISQLDVRVNGRSISNISNYAYIYNAISDWIYNGSNNMDEVGSVADPSTIFTQTNGMIVPRRGFPVSYFSGAAATDNVGCRLLDKYSCRRFIGFLGESSTSIINTALLGDLVIEITLESAGVLIAGSTVTPVTAIIPNQAYGMDYLDDIAVDIIDAADAIAVVAPKLVDLQTYNALSRNFTQGDTGVPTVGNAITGTAWTNYTLAGGGSRALVAGDGTASFTFSNIFFSIVRYEFGDSAYYDALNRALDAGHEFNIFFKNYQSFTGTATTDKNQTMRVSVSSQSLNYLMATFQPPNRYTNTQPINTLIAPPQAGETGSYQATFDSQVSSGLPRTFNNALAFVRNGSKIVQSQWAVDSQQFPAKDLYDIYNENLRHWDKFGKPDAVYKGMQSIYHFTETFFTDVLSLEVPDQYKDGSYQVSGINCKGQPLNIIYNTTGASTTTTGIAQTSNFFNPTMVANQTAAIANNFFSFITI